MADFFKAFEETLNQTAACGVSSRSAAYVASVEHAIDEAWAKLVQVGETYRANQVGSLRGYIAEAHHAGTYNIDAARRGLQDCYAELVNSNGWQSPDVRVYGPSGVLDVQLKYHALAQNNAKGLSGPGFEPMAKIAPSDQIDAVREAAEQRAARIASHRPEQATHLDDTARRVTDRIAKDGAESRPLTTHESTQMAREAQRGELSPELHGYTVEQTLQWSDVGRAAANGAASAAIVSAAVRALPHVLETLLICLREGRFSTDDFERALKEGGRGIAEGAIRGAVAGGIVTACESGLLGEATKSLDPGGIGAATAVAMSAFGDAMRLSRGEITPAQFADRCGRNIVTASAGIVGANVFQTLIPIPVLGAVVGNFVGSIIGTVGYEGTKAAIAALENRQGWEAQVSLGGAIAELASLLQVVGDRTQLLVVVHEEDLAKLAAASETWSRQSASIRAELVDLKLSTFEIRDRTAKQQARIARLRSRPDGLR